jgi:cytosine/adenosine deaminase-related metal-dependent hydrolase
MPLTLYRVGAVRDAGTVNARPGAIAVRGGRIVAAGDPADVQRITGQADRVIDHPGFLVLPGMVNAHAHLDLTHLGPRPYGGHFVEWVRMIIQSRPQDDDAVIAAVRRGVEMSRDAGVWAVADIAGSAAALSERWMTGSAEVAGASFLEVLGLGQRGIDAAILAQRMTEDAQRKQKPRGKVSPYHLDDGIYLGVQPHAPYSTGLGAYQVINAWGRVATTHLAETLEECQFIRDAAGPLADLLRTIGKWDETIRPCGVSPVQHLREILAQGNARWIVAHCNYVDDADIQTLAQTQTSVAYCPVASDYFRHRDHRYRDMLAAGVNVCLGTDSIVCQPADEAQPLGILPQMRRVHRRDGTDPGLLLAMATTHGARAVPCGGRRATLEPGQGGDCMIVPFDPCSPIDPLAQVLTNSSAARRLEPA